jgi:hypothetical protein
MTNYNVEYRYYLTDLVSNQVIAELPFTGVSYQRLLRKAGSFSGQIPVIEATKNYDLYETTMPGRTGLYILRNGVCVWGGMIWSRKYDESSKTLSVDASEFTSYFYHRFVWKTISYGSQFIGVSSFSIDYDDAYGGNVATIEQDPEQEPHGFAPGDFVKITFTSPLIDGTYQIEDTPTDTSFTFLVESPPTASTDVSGGAFRKLYDTYDLTRDLIERMGDDFTEYYEAIGLEYKGFGNEVIEPAQTIEASIISKRVDNGIMTLRTSEDHSMVPGQDFDLYGIDEYLESVNPWTVDSVPDSRTIVFDAGATDIPETPLSGVRTLFITRRKLEKIEVSPGEIVDYATITTHVAHGAAVGQKVTISGIDSPYNTDLDINFDGTFLIESTTPTTITYQLTSVIEVPEEIIYGGLASIGAKVVYSTYGPYRANANIGFDFNNYDSSGKYQDTQVFRGYETKSVGEILEDYSDNINGFEYRVDCDFDIESGSFSRTFTIIDIENPNGSVEYYGADTADLTDEERLGYNKIVFEYPGNISSFTLEENAEDSATRFFTQGDITDLSDAASQPYAVAANTELLDNRSGRSFPLIDALEIVNTTADEDILYQYAEEYLYESRPPMGDIYVRVNGSLNPTVENLKPGEWCTLIIDDPFVLARLDSDQEPRSDILVRKINSFKVSVPDNSFFPEDVDIELIPDWKVDKTGQTYGLRAPRGSN